MIDIKQQEKCCGCTACKNICPVKCIQMMEDFEGFKYPVVNKELCIDCHKCEKVCPIINCSRNNNEPKAYLARIRNNTILEKCTSGGVFTGIASQIIKNGGIAYGAIYDENFKVTHERIDDIKNIEKLSGSKYVQSDMEDVYSKLKRDVTTGKKVVFCGTPCQVAGVKNYLGYDYDNLVLVDLVCHGVPSSRLWKEYLSCMKSKYGEYRYINFRSKHLGYHISVMEEEYKSGKKVYCSPRTNLMSKCFFKNVADRPICYECPFKTDSRCSDLTLFDGWHAEEYVNGLKDDNKGYTVVLVQSEKGKTTIENVDEIELYEIDKNKAIAMDGKMVFNSVNKPKERDYFYKMLDEYGIEETVKKLFPVTIIDRLIDEMKVILKKVGLLEIITSNKKRK